MLKKLVRKRSKVRKAFFISNMAVDCLADDKTFAERDE